MGRHEAVSHRAAARPSTMHSDVYVWMVVRGSLVISPSAQAVELKIQEPETRVVPAVSA